jgi:hypothetical protein
MNGFGFYDMPPCFLKTKRTDHKDNHKLVLVEPSRSRRVLLITIMFSDT